jgi:hypothetical protein
MRRYSVEYLYEKMGDVVNFLTSVINPAVDGRSHLRIKQNKVLCKADPV